MFSFLLFPCLLDASMGREVSWAELPLVVDLSDELTPSSLRQAHWYVDLLTNPPPAPHPFRTFLSEVEAIRFAATKLSSKHSVDPSLVDVAETPVQQMYQQQLPPLHSNEIAGTISSAGEDITARALLEGLRERQGHSLGTALHRRWVRLPQAYLSWMSQRIADVVLRCVMPLVGGGEEYRMGSDKGNKVSERYDVHVRYFPSVTHDSDSQNLFCAEIVVRDVEQLQRINDSVSLLRAKYTAVRAEGQTLQSSLAFWRSVALDGSTDELEGVKGESYGWAGDGISGHAALKPPGGLFGVEGHGGWLQPTRRQMGRGANSQQGRGAGISNSHESPAQSAAGLVAVFYLSFSGVAYAGVVCGGAARRICATASMTGAAGAEGHPSETAPDRTGETDVTTVSHKGEAGDVEPVFFLPCSSGSSFVRGLLGL
ncbi:hypothetical protein, conserved [Trypanosoma brucei brucei TREU927]|uniref:Uncharacterized protein n=2 Tax=Trypanozoon TaxID=39700 RepID=Q580V8_TRYB2|nr:hypothetical protein, conserved [Trypanosoma brucei brucei TREU927]AAX81026.1 hypothetical protein, conserved [Trypanosoma brucei]AAZ10548.1 hypothetical protein, conserved [Trypanosoma brucei brucei TREU927]